MKKTLTVNLGGTVFHIDEDAYQLLDNYLSNLRIHFKKEEGAEEIISDFEMRISELFGERIRLGHEVITIEHTDEVIKRMGKPEDLFDGEDDKKEDNNKNSTNAQYIKVEGKKKLMRDPDNRILGGVAAGIAAYTGWDITAVRLAMILLIFIPYAPIIILYLVLWLVMPLARTAADRLVMRGENVTLENIGKTVTGEFEQISSKVNDYVSSDKPRNFFKQLADLFVTVVGFILKILAVIIGIILLPVLLLIVFVLVVVTIALIGGGAGLLYALLPFNHFPIDGFLYIPTYLTVLGGTGGVLLLGIPIVALIYALCGSLFKLKPLSTPVKWTLFILWIIGIILCAIYGSEMTSLSNWNNYSSLAII